MPVRGFESCMLPLLRALDDGPDHSANEIRERIANEMGLTEEDFERVPPKPWGVRS